ncbi:MAG TPA: hypothetical protein DCL21_05080 [Alphaproteobacteria bacterium]|nr:hypothetical protein [Alphaproteobacteria bacterium]
MSKKINDPKESPSLTLRELMSNFTEDYQSLRSLNRSTRRDLEERLKRHSLSEGQNDEKYSDKKIERLYGCVFNVLIILIAFIAGILVGSSF